MHTQTLLEVVTIINTVQAISFQVGKRHFCIKIAVFKISIGSLLDILHEVIMKQDVTCSSRHHNMFYSISLLPGAKRITGR